MHAHLRVNIYVIAISRATAFGASAKSIRKGGTTNVNHLSFSGYISLIDVNYCELVSLPSVKS